MDACYSSVEQLTRLGKHLNQQAQMTWYSVITDIGSRCWRFVLVFVNSIVVLRALCLDIVEPAYRLYVARYDKDKDDWILAEIFKLKHFGWPWSALLIGDFLYVFHSDEGDVVCAYAHVEDATVASAWRQTIVYPSAAIASEAIGLKERPALACFGVNTLEVACALANPPAGPEDWTRSSVSTGFCQGASLASIQDKPCIVYLDYKGRLGRLAIACAKTATPTSANPLAQINISLAECMPGVRTQSCPAPLTSICRR
jgi:hypothetical protein